MTDSPTIEIEPLTEAAPDEARQSRLATTFAALETPAFRMLALNSLLMITMIQIAVAAQNVVAYDLTGNNRSVGFVQSSLGAAMLLNTLLSGAVADRVAKKRLIWLTQTAIFCVALFLIALTWTGMLNIYLLALAAFFLGSSMSYFGPAQLSFLGEILPMQRRANAAALIQVTLHTARTIGPLLAGAMLASQAIDTKGTYIVLAAISLPLLYTAFRLPLHPPPPPSGAHVIHEIREGLRHVAHNRRLLEVVLAFFVVTMVGFSTVVVLPGYTKDVLHSGKEGFGIIMAANALGSLVAAFVVASLPNAHRASMLMWSCCFVFALLTSLTGLMPTFTLAVIVFFFAGIFSAAYQTLLSAAFLHRAGPAYYGRVVSITMLAWSFTNLLGLLVGAVADLTSERAVLVGVGLALAGIVVVMALWSRSGREAAEPA
ncbi:MAG TPA: MFS transporter [Dehalococcoidia bacterium]|nr:MFS transporter [Dehalococcoidia bacterium]